MSLRVKCVLCDNKFVIRKDETSPLLEHIRNAHPEVNISKSDLNSTNEEQIPNNENQPELFNQKNYENKKYDRFKILEGGDYEINNKNSKIDNFEGKLSMLEINQQKLSNEHFGINPLDDIKIQFEEADKQKMEHFKKESIQNFDKCSDQYQELDSPKEKFVGLYYKQPQQVDMLNPSKLSLSNHEKEPRILYKRRYKLKGIPTYCGTRSFSTEKLYINSIENWKSGQGTIFCPKCLANKQPVIKSHTDKAANSPMGAACLMTCWPLCFLPCLFPAPAKEYLHCSVCNHLLGTYNRQTGVVEPNDVTLGKSPTPRHSTQSSPKDHTYEQISDLQKEETKKSS